MNPHNLLYTQTQYLYILEIKSISQTFFCDKSLKNHYLVYQYQQNNCA